MSGVGPADARRLEEHVRSLEGARHPTRAPDRHRRARDYVARELESAGWTSRKVPFTHGGRTHHNVAATIGAGEGAAPRILVGAHYDTVPGTPGADDNASGVSVLLEVARLLRGRSGARRAELVAFDLEEPRDGTYRIGSRRWVERSRREGVRYRAALVLEMVGYTAAGEGTQAIPWLLRWMDIPRRGTFLAAVADRGSRAVLRRFHGSASEAAPGLELVTVSLPFRGWIVPQSRLSDNASFWDAGIPALMLTDTAFLRNPYYHGPGDRADTLDYGFMARTAVAVAAAVEGLAEES